MAAPLPTPNLSAYDAQLLELAHQLDAERREIILKFAQDLINIPYETEPELRASEFSSQLMH